MADAPLTTLDTYRLLGDSGLRVSPLCLGTMTFGTEWNWGADKEESRRVLDLYLERGGNFVDTANYYTQGTSESWVGEFLEGRRDQVVLSTKYSLNLRPGDPNGGGNHRKSLQQNLEASLRRLRTDYIDLYWVHVWEWRTPVEEVMRALDDAVRAGKVLYVGISDTPAWKVAEANTLARLRGWTPFIALQLEYNLAERTAERDLIPMALDQKIGITPWSPLAAGILTGKHIGAAGADSEKARNVEPKLTERARRIAEETVAVAREVGRSPAQVALNWLLQRPGVTAPILGARLVRQLEDNLGCLDFRLSPDHLDRLDELSAVPLGFPHDFMRKPSVQGYITGGTKIE